MLHTPGLYYIVRLYFIYTLYTFGQQCSGYSNSSKCYSENASAHSVTVVMNITADVALSEGNITLRIPCLRSEKVTNPCNFK